jgi:hypothetical protein
MRIAGPNGRKVSQGDAMDRMHRITKGWTQPKLKDPIMPDQLKTIIEKSPETYGLLTYAWVIGLSAAGGAVAFIRKFKAGHVRAFNVVEFIGECATSAFAGVITFYLCEWSSFSALATAAMVGIAGHMGSRAIANLELFFEARFPKAPTESLIIREENIHDQQPPNQ